MIVSTPREAIWAWMNSRLRIGWSEDFRAIGIVQGDCLRAAVAYNGFVGRACMMHGAIDDPRVVNRTFREAIFSYPFRDLKLECLIGQVDSTNTHMLDMATRLGFSEDYRLRGSGTDGCDLVHLHLYRETWMAHNELRTQRAQSA